MGRSLADLYSTPLEIEDRPYSLIPNRSATLEKLKQKTPIDLTIIGSDLTATIIAHSLALSGVRVLLIAPAHFNPYPGGRLADTFSVLASRNSALTLLKRAIEFRVLRSYAPHRFPQHAGVVENDTGILNKSLHRAFSGAFSRLLSRTLIDEERLIPEILLAIRQEGGLVINHTSISFCESQAKSESYILGLRDDLSCDEFEIQTGALLVGEGEVLPRSRLHENKAEESSKKILTSSSSQHITLALATCHQTNDMAAFYYLSERKNLILLRQLSSTLYLVAYNSEKIALSDVVQAASRSDLNISGFSLEWTPSLQALSSSSEVFERRGGLFVTQNGAARSPISSAKKVLWEYFSAAGRSKSDLVSMKFMKSPGAVSLDKASSMFIQSARKAGVPEDVIEGTVMRLGARVRYIEEADNGFVVENGKILRGELLLARDVDLVETDQDITRYWKWAG